MRTLLFLVSLMAGVMLCQSALANGIKTSYYSTANGIKTSYYATQQVVFFPGSLKSNVERVSGQYGWKQVIWDSPDDYHWVAYTKIRQNRLQDILRVALVNYPLKAVFYKGNHVLVIKPRTMR